MSMRRESEDPEESPLCDGGAPRTQATERRISYFSDVRLLAFRYLRRFGAKLEPVDSLRLAGKLQSRLPSRLAGPGARAVIQHIVIEMAGRNNIPIRW